MPEGLTRGEFLREMGRRRGLTRAMLQTPEERHLQAKKAGLAVYLKYGEDYYRQINPKYGNKRKT